MPAMPGSRQQLRQTLRQLRRQIPPDQQQLAAVKAARHLSGLAQWRAAHHIGAYVATDGELDPLPALLQASGNGARIYLPRTAADWSISFHLWQPGQALQRSNKGIQEPPAQAAVRAALALDVVLLPLVGFDRHGQRLGFGAGCYDRAFEQRRSSAPPPLLIGYAHACQQCAPLEAADWDVPLDLLVTDRELINFTKDHQAWPTG